MAIFKVIAPSGKYKDFSCYIDLVNYITQPIKTPNQLYVARGVSSIYNAPDEMRQVAKLYGECDGTKLRHMILSFDPKENIDTHSAHQIAWLMTDFYADEYQIVAAVHEEHHNVHIHVLMNTINYRTWHKYQGERDDYHRFKNYLKEKLADWGIKALICDS